ncbi:hypothetical protein PIB30_071348 [Stylosanthes scabra]|uniref:Uncharacterized protein n=1 Tax=Stylosanthes scabra TaxID=79078 RepID=A0ABU6WND0_9FABA|nr:hypothetical protein [Stylosanthes scabra]
MIDWVEAFLATSTAGPSSTPLEHPSTFFQGGFPDCSPSLQTHPFTQMYTTPPLFGSQFGSVAPSSSDSGVSGYDPLRDQLASHHEQVTPSAVPPLRRGHRDVRPPLAGQEVALSLLSLGVVVVGVEGNCFVYSVTV